ncbi:MAG: hypothetical protein AMXMBFR23_03400 [Chloroflexota bacterium]
MDLVHRIKLPTTLTLDGATAVALPWYDGFMYDDGGAAAWVNVPAEDCLCNFGDVPAWHAYLTDKYGPPQKVTAWATLGQGEGWAIPHDAAPVRDGERLRARMEDRYEDARPGARVALVAAMREAAEAAREAKA